MADSSARSYDDDDLFSEEHRDADRSAKRDVARRGIATARATLAAARSSIPAKPRQPAGAETAETSP